MDITDVSALLSSVFKYLADKYLQRLKQQTAEETEVLHTSSNKIGNERGLPVICLLLLLGHITHFCVLFLGVFFLKVFLIPLVVTSAARSPATAEKSSHCDLTNRGPRRVKILLEAAACSR